MSINKAILCGNLTREPELRQTANGFSVLGFSLAVNERRKNTAGEWNNYPNYIDCVMYGARAESLSVYMHKGSKVCVEGKLRWSQWERDGQKRSKIEVIVENVDLMSVPHRTDQPTEPIESLAPMVDTSVYDEEIPF